MRAPGNEKPHAVSLLMFDVLCRTWAEGADRRWDPIAGPDGPDGDANLAMTAHRCQILVPPPVFYSQIRLPTEYPNDSTTFTPSVATTPCPHTSVTAPSLPGRPDLFSSRPITTHLLHPVTVRLGTLLIAKSVFALCL